MITFSYNTHSQKEGTSVTLVPSFATAYLLVTQQLYPSCP